MDRFLLGVMTSALPLPSFPLFGAASSASLDFFLKEQFERCRQGNILRTDPLAPDVVRRKIPGRLGLLAEYEPSLFENKRAATVSSHVEIDLPFSKDKFNFNTVGDGEILATVVDRTDESGKSEDVNHRILVNVSPLMYGHGLLVPWSKQCLPQQLTADAIGLAVRLLRRCSDTKCDFCVGFNSLGAFSSVNHLHLHILYPSELDHEARGQPLMDGRKYFPIAYAPIQHNVTEYYRGIDCRIDELQWTVPCFSFASNSDDVCLKRALSHFVRYLQKKRIPHNVLFIHEAGVIRSIVIPRQHQDHFDTNRHGFNAALGEISGMLIARTKQHFDEFTEVDIVRELRCYVACKDDALKDINSELSCLGT